MLFHYNNPNIILLSMLSTKLWDLTVMILWSIINAILWENRTYTLNNGNVDFYNKLLKKISSTYYICSETRLNYENSLIPIGVVIGPNYICEIKTNIEDTIYKNMPIKIVITIYGWFSIKTLLTSDIMNSEKGKYNVVEFNGSYVNDVYTFKENFPEKYFHKNTFVASKYIYDSVMKQHNKSGVYLLHGTPGTGKTTTAKKLFDYFDNTSLICSDLHLIENSAPIYKNLLLFYNKIKPENNKFLIIVIDEVDEIIDKIFSKNGDEVTTSANYTYPSKKYTKQIWNSFLERVVSLDNVILLLTTNKTKKYIDEKDDSLLRKYRLTMSLKFLPDECWIE